MGCLGIQIIPEFFPNFVSVTDKIACINKMIFHRDPYCFFLQVVKASMSSGILALAIFYLPV